MIAPMKGIRVKGNSKPWFDVDIIEVFSVRDIKGKIFFKKTLY